jgi:ketosteroid isomerase-like protein
MRGYLYLAALLGGLCTGSIGAQALPAPTGGGAQSPYTPLGTNGFQINPVTQPTITPGVLQLLELETKFASAVATGGGKAFSTWFAEDAVSLSNGRPPVMGKTAIAAQAQWDPKDYQLTWIAQGAQMGPSNDMGLTWGHYEGTSKDRNGQLVKTSGRYLTVWRKLQDGTWKVAMDASAEEPPDAGTCCSLPKP